MATSDRYTGKNLYATVNGTVISADFTSVSVSRSFGKAEATAGADTHAFYIPTYADSSIDIETFAKSGTNGTTEWGALSGLLGSTTAGTLIWAPEGTATGKAKRTALGFIETLDVEYPFDDVVTLKITFQPTSAITDGVY